LLRPLIFFKFAPYKPGSKGTLAERARTLGLEPLAIKFLNGTARITDANRYIHRDTKGKCTFM